MAETTKEQAKNSEVRSKNTDKVLVSEKGITKEKEKQSKFNDQEVAAGIDFADILEKELKLQKDIGTERKSISAEMEEEAKREYRARYDINILRGQDLEVREGILNPDL